MFARIVGTGSYVPDRVLTNQQLEQMVETSDDWIVQRTGIRERHIAAKNETNDVMGALALGNALADAKMQASKLDLIIVGTNTNETNFPSCGARIQAKISAGCGFFDVQAGCTAFSYALAVADVFIRSGMYRTIAVVGTDRLSAITDYKDRATCVLFGDMACAWILTAGEKPGIIRSILGGDGTKADLIGLTLPDVSRLQERAAGNQPASIFTTGQGYLTMNGKEVYRFAIEALPKACIDVLANTGFGLKDVDMIFPHNANLRIIDSAIERLAEQQKIPQDEVRRRFYHTIAKYGNTSAASNACAFHEALKGGIIRKGNLVILAGFGAGLTYGANLIRV